MTNYFSMIALNVVMFSSLILSLPASAVAQQEVDPTYYDPVPAQTQTVEHAAKPAKDTQAAKQVKQEQQNKNQKHARNNAQTLIAKK